MHTPFLGHQRQHRSRLFPAIAAALALGACGGSDADSSPATTPPPIESVAPDTTLLSADDTVEPDVPDATPADDPDAAEVPIEGPVDTVAGTDPLLDEQWGVTATNVPQAWAVTGGAGVVIAVIDSGVDLDHPDLVDRLVEGWDFVDGDDRPDDPNGHGTHVAGIAAASSNDIGIAGVAPNASIMPVRVLDAEGAGNDDVIADGIRWAADNGADVINLSLGESGFISRFTRGSSLNAAIRQVNADGVVVIAAAGNEGTAGQQYRIGVDLLVVNATDPSGQLTSFSNVGDVRAISAPGEAILSSAPIEPTAIWPGGTDGYEPLDGTSMAAPIVSGVAALALAAGIPPEDVIDVLAATAANPTGDPALGAGVLDAGPALGVTEVVPPPDETTQPPPPTSPTPPTTNAPPAWPDLVADLLSDLDTTIDADCDVGRRTLTVSMRLPENEAGVRLDTELVVAGFTGAGSYPAVGSIDATVPGQSSVAIPVGGTAVVDDGGSGTITVEVSESGVPVSWRCT